MATVLALKWGGPVGSIARDGVAPLLRERLTADAGQAVERDGGVLGLFPSITQGLDCAVVLHRLAAGLAPESKFELRMGLSCGELPVQGAEPSGAPVAEALALCDTARAGDLLVSEAVSLLAQDDRIRRTDASDGGEAAWTLNWRSAAAPLPLPGPVLDARRPWPLLGRAAERSRLAGAIRSAGSGLELAVIEGAPGSGKTRLAAEMALEAHADGALVLYGRSDEDSTVPYQPLVQALDSYVEQASPATLEVLADDLPELSRVLPSLLDRRPATAGDDSGDRYVLFSAVTSVVAAASAGRRLVLILDDLHWADEPTVLMLSHLLRSPLRMSTLVIVTYRSGEVDAAHPLAGVLSEFEGRRETTRTELSGLSFEHLATLADSILDSDAARSDPSLVRTVHRDTGGNPFFATEVLRNLVEAGGAEADRTEAGTGPRPAPRSVRDVIERRIARLGSEGQEALDAAAVIGAEFDADLLERVVAFHDAKLGKVLDAAEAGALVQARAGYGGRYAFSHGLIAQSLYESIPAARRQRLHRRVAEALEEVCGDRPGARVGELARHWYAAAPPDPVRALAYARREGDRALEQRDPHAASVAYERALELHKRIDDGDERQRCDLLIGLGTARRQEGRAEFRQTLLDAARLALRIDDADRLVRAALANTRGFVSEVGEVDDERVAVVREALRAVGGEDSPSRALLLSILAGELVFSAWPERALLSDEALAMARRIGDPLTLCRVLGARFVTLSVPEKLDERLSNMAEQVALADALGDPVGQSEALHWQATALVENCELLAAERSSRRESDVATRLGQPTALWLAAYHRASLANLAGRLEEADRVALEAFEIGVRGGHPDAQMLYATQLLSIRYDQGRLHELQPLIAQVVADSPGIPGYRAPLALSYVEGGLLDEAREVLAIDTASGFSEFGYDSTWLAAMMAYARVCSELREPEAARLLYERLEPWSGQFSFPTVTGWGLVGHLLGTLASVLGRDDEAERRLTEALVTYDRMGAPVWRARAAVDLACLRLERGSDEDDALSLLAEAGTAARRLGSRAIELKAGSLLEHERAAAVLAKHPAVAGPRPSRSRGSRHPGHASSANGGHRPHQDRAPRRAELRREGELWVLGFEARTAHLKDSKGLGYLAELLARPHLEFHAADLQAGPADRGAPGGGALDGLAVRGPGSDAGIELLDGQAKSAYRERLEELREDLEEAESFNDVERAARAREEIDFIAAELAAAVGLGGRDRRAASAAERARVNVTRALRAAIDRVEVFDAGLGRHLAVSIRTGTFCAYDPASQDEVDWEVAGRHQTG